ncbi:PIN domain-containing protein [Nitrospira defluvii]|nr:PIN domain-containing protein [Nitrospira defluvii]
MNVIVDTSVWSLAFRRKSYFPTPPVQELTRLIQEEEPIFLIGVILQELLQGIRSQEHFNRLSGRLKSFPLIEPRRKDYIEAARLRNQCGKKGVQAGTIDFLIAAICIQYHCYLLTTDRDFGLIAEESTLKLL